MAAGGWVTDLLEPELERHFVDIRIDCPYGLEQVAVSHQACLGAVPERLMGRLLAAGCRRNGNIFYTMRCPQCQACVPIRLRGGILRPDRSQRRCLRRNDDLISEIAPLTMSRENLALLERFLSRRFPATQGQAEDYYSGFFLNSVCVTMELRLRKPSGELLGVSVVDVGQDWLSAVYFFFDPDEARRSPGTFNILHLAQFCRRHQLEYLYLGYWIDQIAAMRYKSRFVPHEVLGPGGWELGHSPDRGRGQGPSATPQP